MPTPAVHIENLCYAYNGEAVLEDVCLDVAAGEFVVILGPNGGGKTTLVKCLLGLLTPTRGSVSLLGQAPPLGPGKVGYVPQKLAVHTGMPISVEHVVLLGLRHKKQSKASRRAMAQEALERVEMADCIHAQFAELSGGQQQRALVARALVANPKLLVFDEPTANIDPRGKLCLFELLRSLAGEVTVLVVSHDLIAASAGVTQVAAVNRQLLSARPQEHGSTLTPEMLSLLYGVHDPTCPVDGYLTGIASMLGDNHESLASLSVSANSLAQGKHALRHAPLRTATRPGSDAKGV